MGRSVRALVGLVTTVMLAVVTVAPASATVTAVVVANPGNQTSYTFVDIYPPVQMHASGGTQPYHWSATGLPWNVFIDPTTWVIDGTPIAGAPVTKTTTVTAVDSLGASGSTTFTWTVLPGCRTC
jgi:hypothetical protein